MSKSRRCGTTDLAWEAQQNAESNVLNSIITRFENRKCSHYDLRLSFPVCLRLDTVPPGQKYMKMSLSAPVT